MLSVRGGEVGDAEETELKRRLEKLARTYDLTTMKIFMTVEAMGEGNIYNTYDLEKKMYWEQFLCRREACRLDLSRHDKTRDRYMHFLTSVGREEQGKQFYYAMMELLQTKGAVDVFPHSRSHEKHIINARNHSESFCGQMCRLLDRKLETWFDSFIAVNIRLTAHVKVSNFVRVLTGQIDLLCRKDQMLYAVNVKVTGMATPRPMDLNELCLVKAMVIQNGLASPDGVVCCLLTCHLGEDRPVLRLWEYRPTADMDRAIREADIDKMIDAGRLSPNHEMWRYNMCPPSAGSQTTRLETAPFNNGGLSNRPLPQAISDIPASQNGLENQPPTVHTTVQQPTVHTTVQQPTSQRTVQQPTNAYNSDYRPIAGLG